MRNPVSVIPEAAQPLSGTAGKAGVWGGPGSPLRYGRADTEFFAQASSTRVSINPGAPKRTAVDTMAPGRATSTSAKVSGSATLT